MDENERALFEGSVRRACAGANGATLDRTLGELGWHEALLVDPRTAVSSLFEALGTTNSAASALESVVASALGVSVGTSVPAVLPGIGRWQPPARLIGEHLIVGGVGTASLAESATAWSVADAGEETLVVEVATSDLELRPVAGLDPRLGLVEVTGDHVPFSAPRPLGPSRWPRAVARAQLALGHELVGASRTVLELARAHALERIQFGRPIGSFQAVRHRLAETFVAIEASDAALGSAWDEGSSGSAAAAKALAGRSARTTVRNCQQVLAGIGFTTEHDLHRFVRRILVLDQLFGTSLRLTRELGRELLATRRLPDLPPL
jgi:Acyl-CoA dehydrogenase, C-terminal domain